MIWEEKYNCSPLSQSQPRSQGFSLSEGKALALVESFYHFGQMGPFPFSKNFRKFPLEMFIGEERVPFETIASSFHSQAPFSLPAFRDKIQNGGSRVDVKWNQTFSLSTTLLSA